jgi:cell division protein FtsL
MPLQHPSFAHAIAAPKFRYPQVTAKTEQAKGVFVTYLIVLILLAFTCCLFYIWSRIQIVNVGYEINRELSIKEKLGEENKRLSMEVATLKSPVRLEALAKNDYHMDLPQKSQILSEPTSKILEVSPAIAPKEQTAKAPASAKTSAKIVAKAPTSSSSTKALKKAPSLLAQKKNSSPTTVSKTAALKSPTSTTLAQKAADRKGRTPSSSSLEKTKSKAVLTNPKAPVSKSSLGKVASTAGEHPPH